MSNKELIEEMIKTLDLQNEFILRIFSDDRVGEEVKYEWAKKYNKLGIKNYRKMAEHDLI